MRRFASPAVMNALAACGRDVFVYGLGERAAEGRLRFQAIDERRFLDHLAGCDALISTAGNQLVGEALYLRKPVLVLPEERNFEQSVNAYFLEQSGAGWAERGALTAQRLGAFLECVESLRARIAPEAVCGNFEAVAALERTLQAATGAAPAPALGTRAPARSRAVPRTQWA
jgi:UDP:flavonoid glycosyltransferase YjiC (YdhE family)